MLNDSTFGSDLAELTYPELRDVAEKLRARLQELERDARANKAAPSDHAPPPHPASPDIGREPVFGDDGKHLGSRGSGRDTTQVSAEKEPHQSCYLQ